MHKHIHENIHYTNDVVKYSVCLSIRVRTQSRLPCLCSVGCTQSYIESPGGKCCPVKCSEHAATRQSVPTCFKY